MNLVQVIEGAMKTAPPKAPKRKPGAKAAGNGKNVNGKTNQRAARSTGRSGTRAQA
jgi:hypothetical protein